jgi:hypothetical protein
MDKEASEDISASRLAAFFGMMPVLRTLRKLPIANLNN